MRRVKLNDYNKGDLMRILREWTELNQTDFGKEIGKSKRTIQDYEAGIINYNIKTLNDIAKRFNIEIIFEQKSNRS